MVLVLALTSAPEGDPALPALELLSHGIRRHPLDAARLLDLPGCDAVLVPGLTAQVRVNRESFLC